MPPDDPVDLTPPEFQQGVYGKLTKVYRKTNSKVGWRPAAEFAQAYLDSVRQRGGAPTADDEFTAKDWAERIDTWQKSNPNTKALYEAPPTESALERGRQAQVDDLPWGLKWTASGPAMVVGNAFGAFAHEYLPAGKAAMKGLSEGVAAVFGKKIDYEKNIQDMRELATEYSPAATQISEQGAAMIGMLKNPLTKGAMRLTGAALPTALGTGARAAHLARAGRLTRMARGGAGFAVGGMAQQGTNEIASALGGPKAPGELDADGNLNGTSVVGRLARTGVNMGLAGAFGAAVAPAKHAFQAALQAAGGRLHPYVQRALASFTANFGEGMGFGALPHLDETGFHATALNQILGGGKEARGAWGGLLVSGFLNGALGTSTKVDPAVFEARVKAKLTAAGIPEHQHRAVTAQILDLAKTVDKNLSSPVFDSAAQATIDVFQRGQEAAKNPQPPKGAEPVEPVAVDDGGLVPPERRLGGPALTPAAPMQAATPGDLAALRRAAQPAGRVPGGAERPGEFAAPLATGAALRAGNRRGPGNDAGLAAPGTAAFDTALTEPVLTVYTRKEDGVPMEVVQTARGPQAREAKAPPPDEPPAAAAVATPAEPPKPAPPAAAAEFDAETILEATKKNGGHTVNLRGESPTKGVAVAVDKAHEANLGQAENVRPEDIQEYVDHNRAELAKPERHLGTLIDDKGNLILDISEVVPDVIEASRRGRERGQRGVYDIGAGQEHRLDTPEAPAATKVAPVARPDVSTQVDPAKNPAEMAGSPKPRTLEEIHEAGASKKKDAKGEEPSEDELDALAAEATGAPMSFRGGGATKDITPAYLAARPMHDRRAPRPVRAPHAERAGAAKDAVRLSETTGGRAPLPDPNNTAPSSAPMDRVASLGGERGEAAKAALEKVFVDENEVRVSPLREVTAALEPVYGADAQAMAKRIRDGLAAPKGQELDETGPMTDELKALERDPLVTSLSDEDGVPVKVGDVVEVTKPDGTVDSGRVAGETGARVRVGKTNVRKSDAKKVTVVKDPSREALLEALATGDALKIEQATEAFANDRSATTIEGVGDPEVAKAAERNALIPFDVPARDFQDSLGAPGQAQFWPYQKAEKALGRSYPELVQSELGTYEVIRGKDSATVRLVPVTQTDKIKPRGTILSVNGVAPETAKGLYNLFEAGAHKVWDPVAHLLTRMLGYPLFGEKVPWHDLMRRNLTENGRDPGLNRMDSERRGGLEADVEKFVSPILTHTLAVPKERQREIILAHQRGESVPGFEAIHDAMRAASDDAAQRLIREGAMRAEVWKTHQKDGKSTYVPWSNWKNKGKAKTVLTPGEGLTRVTGPQPVNPLDARGVLAMGQRMQARDSYKTIEEAEANGLDITSHPLADFVEAVLVEQRAGHMLEYFRKLRDYGVAHQDKLVLTPEDAQKMTRDEAGDVMAYTFVPDRAVNAYGHGGWRANKEGVMEEYGARVDANGKSFGALAGHLVHDSVWSQLETFIDHRGEVGATYDLFHTMGRKAKTVFRPGGHLVQKLGNPIIWAMDGVPYSKLMQVRRWGRAADKNDVAALPKGLTVLVNGKEVAPTREALLRGGVFEGSGATVEGQSTRAYKGLGHGGPSDVVAKFGNAVEGLVPFKSRFERGYGSSDEVSRAGLYLYHRSIGRDHAEALSHVHRWYDMRNVPRGIKGAARWISFFRFQYKMMQNTEAILKETPFTAVKVGLAFAALRQAQRLMLDMDQDEYDHALEAAMPGDGMLASIKRSFALPWFNDEGRAGFWSVWNLFPQQGVAQGLMPTPAEESGGGGLVGYGRKVGMYLIGGANTVFKPLVERVTDTDSWTGGKLSRREKLTGESSQLDRLAAAGRFFAKAWSPDILGGGVGVVDSAGLLPDFASSRKPDADGHFKSVADATTEMLGVTPKRPVETAWKAAKQREALDDNPDVYPEDGDYRVRSDVTDRGAQKAARKAINQYSGGNGSLAEAKGHRAAAWLKEGNVEEARRILGSDAGRWRGILRSLSEKDREELRGLAEHYGVVPGRMAK